MSFRNEQGEVELPKWVELFAYVVVWAILAVGVHLGISFIVWDLDPATWSTGTRVVEAVLWVAIIASLKESDGGIEE